MKRLIYMPKALYTFFSFILVIFSVAPFVHVVKAAIPQEDHLLVYYDFDRKEAEDLSENGNDGILLGGGWADSMEGYGKAYEMPFVQVDGTRLVGEGQIDIPGMSDFHIDKAEPFTITAWLKTSCPDAGCRGSVIAKDTSFRIEAPAYGNWRMLVQNRPGAPGNEIRVNGGAFPLKDAEQWIHIAVVYDGKEVKLYKDGQPDGKLEETPDGSNGGFGIKPGFGSYTGLIDEFAVWNADLTDKEISEIMSAPMTSEKVKAVEPSDKLPTRWGKVKKQIQ